MFFDYAIVLAFVFAGAMFGLARRSKASERTGSADTNQAGAGGPPSGAAVPLPDANEPRIAVIAAALLAAAPVLFAGALVLRDCLLDREAAQSTGVGARGLLAGGLFCAILLLAVVAVRRRDLPRAGDPAADRGP